MLKKNYPYQNMSLSNIKGEKWKDIPGFEDQYQLSSYGRLKSLDRWVDYGMFDVFRRGRIKKLHTSGSAKNRHSLDLQMQLHKEGHRYRFSVARLVYHLFVAPFDLEDHAFIVTRKDKDILNCHYKNLRLRSISDVAREGFATNRRASQFQLNSKPVTQYDSAGVMMATFADAKSAATATGVSQPYISGAAKTRHRMAGGYYWRYGKPKAKIKVVDLKKKLALSQESDSSNPLPPYLNRNDRNFPGEKWADIMGFEGFYKISDHGRVKSLRRLKNMTTATGKKNQSWTREFIMKQGLRKSHNHYIDKPLYYLGIRLKNEKETVGFLISSLVYAAFSKEKTEPGATIIIHLDGDNLNNHISNLQKTTHTEVRKLSFAGKRRKSHFASLTQKQRREYAQLAAKANKRPVTQYNLQGKVIARFDSILEAGKAMGILPSNISNAIHGRLQTAGGFIWKKGSPKD